ncbi:MAG TPA: GH25 family lysozyme, partial [Minicystis sp.]|nr:GH25 family lysozyme [Minicystis sp.]
IAIAVAPLLASCAASTDVDGEGVGATDDALSCPANAVRGVDVSDYQQHVDWHAVKASGVGFAYAQAADGAAFTDQTFVANWQGIKAAGMLRGAYQYFEPSEGGAAQADVLLARLEAAGGFDDGDLPPALDIETTDGQSGAVVASRALDWANRIEQQLHKKPLVYVAPGFFSSIGSPHSLTKLPLWEADWGVSCPSLPAGFGSYAFWQSTDHASVPGIAGAVDGDRFRGSLADLQAFAGAGGGPKGPSLPALEAVVGIAEMDGSGSTDVDGDGKADACAFNGASIRCYLSHGHAFADAPIDGPDLPGDEASQRAFYSTIRFADIDGNGKADVCAREKSGMVCWRSDGHGFGKALHTGKLSDADGFGDPSNYGTIRLADVDGDGKADLCARTNKTFKCWLSTGHGFDQAIDGPDWSDDAGFDEQSHWATIRMADVDGDGRADVCARTHDRIACWLSNGHGFPTHVSGPALDDDAWHDADNWATVRFGDINGDHKADLCLRRNDGISCWRSRGDHFGHEIQGPRLSTHDGWDQFDKYSTIRLADVDGDGRADLCARRNAGMTCWPSRSDHFGAAVETTMLADDVHGDDPSHYRTIRFADVDGDGAQDLCYRSGDGLSCHLANGQGGFGAAIPGPAWSHANGWDEQRRYATIMLNGP